MTIVKRLLRLITGSIRYRLLALALIPMFLVMVTVSGMAYFWSNGVSYRQLLMKVNTDLSVVHDAFVGSQKRYLAEMTLFAGSHEFRNVVRSLLVGRGKFQPIEQQMERFRQESEFDFVYLMGLDGCDSFGGRGCGVKSTVLMERAAIGEPAVGLEIFSAEELAAIAPELAERVYLPLSPTPHAVPTERTVEDRGMLIHVVYPILGDGGEVRAYLAGGVLVNGKFEFVDTLRDLVYGSGSLTENSLGTVTVFIDDVRINTNVPGQSESSSQRALGTRVSREVREQVLGRGEKWVDRAFVVSDWYVSAYEPVVDVNGERVGMLYAGFQEAPFIAVNNQALERLVILFLLVTMFSVLLVVIGAKSIFRPVEAMAKVMLQVHRQPGLRIGELDSGDEISQLANKFDAMLDQLQRQREQIQTAADGLECKVKERTIELQQRTTDLQKNLDLLKRTRQQLVAKGKLAAIGELTAGIAHEINNPTAVILGNMDLLMEELGSDGDPVYEEFTLIIEQVYRIRAFINNLLQFSRPNDYLAATVKVDINKVINDSLILVHHDLSEKSIEVNLDLRASILVTGNHQQLQQVFINLIVNAIGAMNALNKRGKLTIRSRNWHSRGVLIIVRDNGCGIGPLILPRIFDPFFTRSKGGTGLGLSVSYGILERFGAEIQVRSKVGVGSCFYLWFHMDSTAGEEGDALGRSIV